LNPGSLPIPRGISRQNWAGRDWFSAAWVIRRNVGLDLAEVLLRATLYLMLDTTLNWRDVLDIGRGLWDDVTRCRIASRDWGAAVAIHPSFGGPQSIIICGDRLDGFIETASWKTALDKATRYPMTEGAWIERGPLTVWRRPMSCDQTGHTLGALLDRRICSLPDIGHTGGMFARVYFRQGPFDHAFCIGDSWREPRHQDYRDLLALFMPFLKPSLQLYFSDS